MSTPLPPGYSPASHALTANDHGGLASIASGIGLVFILLFVTMRVWLRYPLRTKPYLDDSLVAVATVRTIDVRECRSITTHTVTQFFSVIQAILVLGAVRKGLGKAQHLLDS